MTVNINAGNISSIRLVEQSAAPSAPSGSAARLYLNADTVRKLCIRDSSQITTFLGNSSGSGTGITFPATQDASSNANTLDDYEEGTWTPVLNGSTGLIGGYTATVEVGRYTKIGRVVSITASVTLSNAGSWTGDLQCNLPLSVASSYGNDIPRGAVRMQLHTFTGQINVEPVSATRVRFNLTTSGGGQANMQYTGISAAAGNFLSFSLVYETNT